MEIGWHWTYNCGGIGALWAKKKLPEFALNLLPSNRNLKNRNVLCMKKERKLRIKQRNTSPPPSPVSNSAKHLSSPLPSPNFSDFSFRVILGQYKFLQ